MISGLLGCHRAKSPSTHVERHRRAPDAFRLQVAQKLVGEVKPCGGCRHAAAGVFFGVHGLVVL